jgi:hypothetical protein
MEVLTLIEQRRRINSESGDDDNGRSRRDIAPPSPVEREQNIEAMTSKQLRKAASLKRQQEGNNTTVRAFRPPEHFA